MFGVKKIGSLKPISAGDIKSSRLGIGFEKLDRDVFDPEKAYDKLAAIGVKWVRIQSGWERTEKEKGVYDFAWIDSIVDDLIERGMKPWMCVCYGNGLYDERAAKVFGAVGCPPIHTEEQRAAWHNYCLALAKHFRGRSDHFEIWNEPDGDWCWKHGANGTELGNFTIDTAKALKEGNPDAYIIGGAVCIASGVFLAEALETGMADYIDAISYHEYTFGENELPQRVRMLKGLARLYGNHPIDIIQGESGSQSRSGGHGALRVGAWTPERQAKQLLRHLTTDLLCGVKFTSYFTCVDMIEALNGIRGEKASYLDYGYFGVLGADFDDEGHSTGEYSPKLSYYALQSLAALLGGDLKNTELPIRIVPGEKAAYAGMTPDITFKEAVSGGFELDDGSYAFAYWYPENYMTKSFEGTVTVECMMRGVIPTIVDPMDGSIYEIPETWTVTHKGGSFTFKHIPIKDYPMFLVFKNVPKEINKNGDNKQ